MLLCKPRPCRCERRSRWYALDISTQQNTADRLCVSRKPWQRHSFRDQNCIQRSPRLSPTECGFREQMTSLARQFKGDVFHRQSCTETTGAALTFRHFQGRWFEEVGKTNSPSRRVQKKPPTAVFIWFKIQVCYIDTHHLKLPVIKHCCSAQQKHSFHVVTHNELTLEGGRVVCHWLPGDNG